MVASMLESFTSHDAMNTTFAKKGILMMALEEYCEIWQFLIQRILSGGFSMPILAPDRLTEVGGTERGAADLAAGVMMPPVAWNLAGFCAIATSGKVYVVSFCSGGESFSSILDSREKPPSFYCSLSPVKYTRDTIVIEYADKIIFSCIGR
jgi:hypothetical protein